MAEVKRSRQQSFLNRPIGVVNVTTNAEKKYAAEARSFDSVSNTFFNLTQTLQVKEGEKFAAKYKVRDENNNLRYEKVPFSLGRFGRAAAEEEINKKYLLGLKQDAFEIASQLRIESRNDSEFSESYSKWIEERAKLVDGDAGPSVAEQFVNNSRQLLVEHASGMKAEAFKAEQVLSASQYELDMREMQSQMAQAQLAGDFEEAEIIRALIEKSLDEDAIQSFKLSGEKRRDLVNASNDTYRNSKFQKMVENVSFSGLAILESEIESGVISDNVSKKFPELKELVAEYATDPIRRNTFNTFISGLREARRLQEASVGAQASIKAKLETNRLTNTTGDKKDFTAYLGYKSPLDALDVNFIGSHQVENNAAAPSQALSELAQMVSKGSLLPNQRMAFGQRLLDIDAAQGLINRGVENYFGGKLGASMLRELILFRSLSALGEEEMIRYYEQEDDFDSLEVKTRMAKSAGYRRGKLQDVSAQEIAEYYVDKNFSASALPGNAREELVPQVMYFLNNDSSIDVQGKIEEYVDRYYAPSYFYERSIVSEDYSLFVNPPERFLNSDELKLFKARVDTLGSASAKTYLEPISYSDLSAVYVPYQIGPNGSKNYIFRGGRMVQINTLNFQKSNAALAKTEQERLNLMRQQALSE